MAKRISVQRAADKLGSVVRLDAQEKVAEVGSLGIESARLDIRLRKAMGWTLIALLVGVNIWAFGLVTLVGWSNWSKLVLSDAVLLGVIAATVADVTGIVIIMAKYLFPKRSAN